MILRWAYLQGILQSYRLSPLIEASKWKSQVVSRQYKNFDQKQRWDIATDDPSVARWWYSLSPRYHHLLGMRPRLQDAQQCTYAWTLLGDGHVHVSAMKQRRNHKALLVANLLGSENILDTYRCLEILAGYFHFHRSNQKSWPFLNSFQPRPASLCTLGSSKCNISPNLSNIWCSLKPFGLNVLPSASVNCGAGSSALDRLSLVRPLTTLLWSSLENSRERGSLGETTSIRACETLASLNRLSLTRSWSDVNDRGVREPLFTFLGLPACSDVDM